MYRGDYCCVNGLARIVRYCRMITARWTLELMSRILIAIPRDRAGFTDERKVLIFLNYYGKQAIIIAESS
jgi:hypothetical protein